MVLTESDQAFTLTFMDAEARDAVDAMIAECRTRWIPRQRDREWSQEREAAFRAELREARDAGLVERHAAKLARNRAQQQIV